MITLYMCLIPFGQRALGEHPLLTMQIASERDDEGRPVHMYSIALPDHPVRLHGSVHKFMSGHRNPAHLLKSIMNSIDLAPLGHDYVKTIFDAPRIERPPDR